MKCRCGCKDDAKWLLTFNCEEGAVSDEPACESASRYIEEMANEFGFEFQKRRIEND